MAENGSHPRHHRTDRGDELAAPGPIQTRTYREGTVEATALRFQFDAAEAARAGWFPTSQSWEGTALTVVYRQHPETASGGQRLGADVGRVVGVIVIATLVLLIGLWLLLWALTVGV